jgi:UTP--glucose-1-phosphate uridylyltransferase
VGEAPFVVLLGDEFTEESHPLLPQMIELQSRTGGIVLAFIEVPEDQVNRYGIASVEPATDISNMDNVVRVTGLVEKPPIGQAPSNLAVVGRYVLPSGIFEAIRQTKPGSGGEIQLTDAMALMLAEGTPVHGIIYRGIRFDTGMPLGYLQTVVQIASQREDLGPAFTEWLREYVNTLPGGTPA